MATTRDRRMTLEDYLSYDDRLGSTLFPDLDLTAAHVLNSDRES